MSVTASASYTVSTLRPSGLLAALGQEHLVRWLLGHKAFGVGNEPKPRAAVSCTVFHRRRGARVGGVSNHPSWRRPTTYLAESATRIPSADTTHDGRKVT